MTAAISVALHAFYLEHRCCGELESDVDNERVRMACSCGAVLVRVAALG